MEIFTILALQSLDSIPCFKAPGMKRYFAILHYDGMPLNIGTFPRQEHGETFFDGILPSIKLQKMRVASRRKQCST